MLPTFVIGLREALEASLIVGIIAAFLVRQGRRDLMRWVAAGVGAAIVLCGAGGVALYVVSGNLPQRQQEALETVVGLIAVAMVTYMVVWMRRHARGLKRQLEGVAGSALAQGSGWALVGMAFLAVLREGFETSVFLVAAFNESASTATAGGGALLGIVLAVALGYGIYRGGVSLNLSKFFRITGVVLVFVAAGLVQTALRTAHEAGWLNAGQQATVDLSAVVAPGSVRSALITGMLGIQPQPRLIELVGWLLYLVPVGVYVVWPPGRGLPRRTVAAGLGIAAVVVGSTAGALVGLAPAVPSGAGRLTGTAAGPTAPLAGPVVVALDAASHRLLVSTVDLAQGTTGATVTVDVRDGAAVTVDGLTSRQYVATLATVSRTTALTYDQIAARNGGRLPLGLRAGSVAATTTPVRDTLTTMVTVTASAGRVVAAHWSQQEAVVAAGPAGDVALAPRVGTATLAPTTAAAAVAAARHAAATSATRQARLGGAQVLGGTAAALLLAAAAMLLVRRPRRRAATVSSLRASAVSSKPTSASA